MGAPFTNRLPVDGDRLWNDLMALAAITDPERPWTRRSFTPRFLEGRTWLRRRFEEAGLAVRIDAAGNLIGRREGTDGVGTIMLGSHSDTVPSGGRFDGVAGVIAALEIARSLDEAGVRTRHAIEVVDFLAEEPSEYGLSCVGSRGMAGLLDEAMLALPGPGGERLGEAIGRMGGDVGRLGETRRDDIAAFFELHIEQGVVLERSGVALGLVTGIVGIARIEIRFEGRADHAGTTPMELRRDAALAAARTIVAVEAMARAEAGAGRGHFAATVGVLEIAPNATNIVPGAARLVVDVRAEDQARSQAFLDALDAESAAIARAARVERPGFTLLSRTTPAACGAGLRAHLAAGAADLGLSTLDLASGAGHDAAFLARIAPSAMVFVPCRDGRSHAPEEWAEPEALARGAGAILRAVLRVDAEGR